MQLFEVNYSLGSSNGYSTFQPSSTQTQFLKTVVQAQHIGQARLIVEGMFGGLNSCQIHSVTPQ